MIQWLAEKVLGMPTRTADSGAGVDALMVYIHALMFVLFVGWVIYFGYAVWRFRQSRHPKADHHGVQSHASTYLEAAVAAIEGILLIGIAIPVWAHTVDKLPKESESTLVQVVAQQFQWNVRYPGKDGKFGKQDMRFVTADNVFGVDPADPNGKDDIQMINEIHVPVNKPVIIYLSSKDVIHSFKVYGMRVTQDCIPGLRIPVWFRPSKTGTNQIYCAQLCGAGHASMAGGRLIVQTPEDYQKWMDAKTASAAPPPPATGIE
jgi:cytochrome c oxidase subunit 2